MNIQELLTSAQLTERERSLCDEVAPYLKGYTDNRNGVTLSSYVLTQLIDDGEIAGHEPGGDTLARYDSDLASALAKLEAHLPAPNPLEVIESDPFAAVESVED